MELLLPKRFLVFLVALVALAGAVYLADGRHRAAVMGTVWGLADRVAALIVPGDVEEVAGVQVSEQAGRVMTTTPTSIFTPPVMPAAVFEQERKKTPTPAPTATPTATPTLAPTPTPPPTPEPEVVGTPEVRIENTDGYIKVMITVPPVRQTRYRYDARARQWYPVTTLVPYPIDTESVEWWIEMSAETPVPDVDLDLRTTDYRLQETFEGLQYRLVLTTTVEITGTYYIVFQAHTQDGRLIQAIQEVTP